MTVHSPEWAVPIHQKLAQLDTKLDQVLDQLQQLTTARTQPAPTHPTFCGYPCSWDINDAGWPAYILLEDGTRALHREKQGDHWYSVALGDGQYGEHYLKIRRPSPPEGALIIPSPPSHPAPDPAPGKPPQPCPHRKNVGAALVAALRVRLFVCGKTNAAHRYPRPHHFVLKYGGLARACIHLHYRCRPSGTAATASAFTSRLILAAPRSTGVQKVSNQGPGTRLRAQGAGQESVRIGCAPCAQR